MTERWSNLFQIAQQREGQLLLATVYMDTYINHKSLCYLGTQNGTVKYPSTNSWIDSTNAVGTNPPTISEQVLLPISGPSTVFLGVVLPSKRWPRSRILMKVGALTKTRQSPAPQVHGCINDFAIFDNTNFTSPFMSSRTQLCCSPFVSSFWGRIVFHLPCVVIKAGDKSHSTLQIHASPAFLHDFCIREIRMNRTSYVAPPAEFASQSSFVTNRLEFPSTTTHYASLSEVVSSMRNASLSAQC